MNVLKSLSMKRTKYRFSFIDLLFMKVKDINELFKVTFTSIFLMLLLIPVNHHFFLP